MCSILFARDAEAPPLNRSAPSCLGDLNLDQVVHTLTAGRAYYDLEPLFFTLLRDPDDVRYRQEVFRDLESDMLVERIHRFGHGMREMRRCLSHAETSDYPHQHDRWLTDAIATYCATARALSRDLAGVDVRSRGLRAIQEYVDRLVASAGFRTLETEAERVLRALAGVQYCLRIDGPAVKVRRYDGEEDLQPLVERIFEKFRLQPKNDYLVDFQTTPALNHVDGKVLDLVGRLFPAEFGLLRAFCARNETFTDPTVVRFDREIQFYIAVMEVMAGLQTEGLRFCYPDVVTDRVSTFGRDMFDIALAHEVARRGEPVVCNEFSLTERERVLVVTGPNQGGKTTFARSVGQLHYLAALGMPVPGTRARLPLVDAVRTHFGREEDLSELRGKLEDELLRIRAILDDATPETLIIMNEIFASTAAQDAVFLGEKVLQEVFTIGASAVMVTFLDELADSRDGIVSMVATVDPTDPAVRTFSVVRAPADGLAYAATLARKHRLGYGAVRERVSQ